MRYIKISDKLSQEESRQAEIKLVIVSFLTLVIGLINAIN